MRTFWYKITKPFRRFFAWLVKSIQYASFLWKDTDYDYQSLLELMVFKLEKMEKYIRDGHLVSGPDKADEIQKAINGLNILIEDEFAVEEYEAHYKKYGELLAKEDKNWLVRPFFEGESEAHSRIAEREEAERQAAYEDTFYFIGNNIRNWWD